MTQPCCESQARGKRWHDPGCSVALLGTPAERIERTTAKIEANGYTLRYVDYCEDHETPGLLGQIRGAVNHERREVKVGRKANPTGVALADALDHELRHILEPEWDCGSRDVLGRGGPR
jgi:hypothetical protein